MTALDNPSLIPRLRMLAGVASAVPIAAAALSVGVLSGSQRRGTNFFTSNWPQLLLRTAGVTLNVSGAENLTSRRPAVFIFNHRNNFDGIITIALVRDDWTAVAKQAVKNDPIIGTLGRVLGAAFIDRDDTRRAVEDLQELEKLARAGMSIVISPEGTRTDTTAVGPFKKGPFRIAMSVGIPIVPVVIRNARDISARDSMTITPGTVDVAVLDPIDVSDWTPHNLTGRIAAVRQLYIDTLTHWRPGGAPASQAHRSRR
jgi:putative phosphoserine phosphatase/1-acylglycerol-3-phosphate O-acyltransferase